MRRFNHSNHNRKNGNHFFAKKGNFGRARKKLDPSLFVSKVIEPEVGEQYISNTKFSDYDIVDKIKRNIQEHGYSTPTNIQEKAIPHILLGKDLIGIANTGTGKTAAFLITLINKSFLDRNQRVLIVVPTRELAIQISEEFRIFAKGTGLEALAVVGGANIKKQAYALRHRPHFVIGTPGRLKDLIERRELNLMLFQNIVLDEVDKMVDIGFIKDIRYLVSLLPKSRQSLFFSATVDFKTQDILKSFVTDPVTVTVKQQEAAENIEQNIVKVENGYKKIDKLHDLLIQEDFSKVLIFGRTKWGIQKLTNELISRGFKASAIHGNKTQGQRQKALAQFKSSEVKILLATDVASRGLDIEDVSHVINYDAPECYDDYVHRIGRTGRAGKKGAALTFVE